MFFFNFIDNFLFPGISRRSSGSSSSMFSWSSSFYRKSTRPGFNLPWLSGLNFIEGLWGRKSVQSGTSKRIIYDGYVAFTQGAKVGTLGRQNERYRSYVWLAHSHVAIDDDWNTCYLIWRGLLALIIKARMPKSSQFDTASVSNSHQLLHMHCL